MALQSWTREGRAGILSSSNKEDVPYKGGQEAALALKLSLTETRVEEHLQRVSLLLQFILISKFVSWCFTLKHTLIYPGKLVQDLLQSSTKTGSRASSASFTFSGFFCLSSSIEGTEKLWGKKWRTDRSFPLFSPQLPAIVFGEVQFSIGQVPTESPFCCLALFVCPSPCSLPII